MRSDDPELQQQQARLAEPLRLTPLTGATVAGTATLHYASIPPREPPPAPPAAGTPPVPEPTQGDIRVGYILALALPAVYVLFLGFFAVMWLVVDKSTLRDVVLGGFTFLAGYTASDLGHFLGGKQVVSAVNTGVGLQPTADALSQRR